MVFALYNSPSGGPALWTETQNNISVANGIYSVTLGAVTPLSLAFDTQYYLGVAVGADAEMTPRQPLSSVAYAFRADKDTLNSLSCTSGQVPKWNGISWACANDADTNSGGTITSVSAGTGLTGGGSSGGVTVSLSTPVSVANGGTAATTASGARTNIGAAASGVNSDITSLTGLNAQSAVKINPYGSSTGNTGEVRFQELAANGVNYVGLKAPDSLPSNRIWTLPSADGAAGQVLRTDGAGILGWSTPAAGTITGVSAGTGLTGGGSSGSVTLNANIGTGAVQVAAGNHSHDATYLNVSGDEMAGDLRMNNNEIWLRDGTDTFHGLSWYASNSFAGSNPDGPVLFGCGGGGLGSSCGGQALALTWNNSGNVGIGTTTPGQKLTVAGKIESTSGGIKFPDGTEQATASAPIWDQILPAAERFVVVMGNVAVLDRETGLVWQRSTDGVQQDWYNATMYCYGLNLGGRMGWRLPTVDQLTSLVDPSRYPTLPEGSPFTSFDALAYWSSTDYIDPNHAWYVYFSDGHVSANAKNYSIGTGALCVRGGY